MSEAVEFDWGDVVVGTKLVYYYIDRLNSYNECEKNLTIGKVYRVKDMYIHMPIIIVKDDNKKLMSISYFDFISLSEYRNKSIKEILE